MNISEFNSDRNSITFLKKERWQEIKVCRHLFARVKLVRSCFGLSSCYNLMNGNWWLLINILIMPMPTSWKRLISFYLETNLFLCFFVSPLFSYVSHFYFWRNINKSQLLDIYVISNKRISPSFLYFLLLFTFISEAT